MEPYRLVDWEVLSYCPQIPNYFYISGETEFGKGLTTARIVSVSGNIVVDRNNQIYELGVPAPEYIEWCRRNKCHVPTAEEPIAKSGTFDSKPVPDFLRKLIQYPL